MDSPTMNNSDVDDDDDEIFINIDIRYIVL